MNHTTDFKVRISCRTYNHAPYIADTMNGFCMQKTDFPYVAIIVDDASTDGEQGVINNYIHEHFDLEEKDVVRNEETDDYALIFARHKENKNCFFAVFLLKYNHYSIKKPKWTYYLEFAKTPKYIALCEGDDYWTDSNKLQTQVDFLEKHPDYSMCCCRAKRLSVRNNSYKEKDNYCRIGDGDLSPKDIIRRGGFYIPTCSIVYLKDILNDYPEYCRKSPVGDYPLQMWSSMKGKVYYFDTPMATFRVDNSKSWTGNAIAKKDFSENDLESFKRQVNMLKGFANDYPIYTKQFYGKIEFYINSKFRSLYANDSVNQKILNYFREDINRYSIRGKIDVRMRLCGNRYLASLYYRTIFKLMFRNYLDLY